MANELEMNPQETKMQAILAGYLATREEMEPSGAHLDADSIAAFAEGRLTEREAKPFVAHVVDCSFCRRVTAEIVRLDAAFGNAPAAVPAPTAEPTRISGVLSGLLGKIFGQSEGAVFAHNEEEPDTEKKPANGEDENASDRK